MAKVKRKKKAKSMAAIRISIINASTVIQDADLQKCVAALQKQVREDFAPIWGIDADLLFVAKGQKPEPNTWLLVILDTSDQAGALGYHDLSSDGLPIAKVFAKSDLDAGSSWTVTVSHELLEMLVDPDINLTVLVELPNKLQRLYAYEVCDACEDDSFGYKIGDVLVSDFVFPSWFESFRAPGSTQFDYQKKLSAPFQLLQGGYISILDFGASHGWTQITADERLDRKAAVAPLGSRRERRRTPKMHWRKSTTPA